MVTKKIIVEIFLVALAASVITASVYAQRNYLGKPRSTSSLLQTPATSPSPIPLITPSSQPTPTRTPNPTPTRTPRPTPTRTPRPVNTSRSTNSQTQKPVITPKPTLSENSTSVYITYYGWNDNDPPGTAIAYPKSENQSSVHSAAGGVGTFDDPVTFAADPKVFSPGTKIYVPYIKKYILMEDSCAGCSGKKQIDIWAGGNGQNENKLLNCEETLTRNSETVMTNPANGLNVDTTPIFDATTTTCIN